MFYSILEIAPENANFWVLYCIEFSPEDAREGKMMNTPLFWQYFKFWFSFLIHLLICLFSEFSNSYFCFLSSFYSWIQLEIKGRICLSYLDLEPWFYILNSYRIKYCFITLIKHFMLWVYVLLWAKESHITMLCLIDIILQQSGITGSIELQSYGIIFFSSLRIF